MFRLAQASLALLPKAAALKRGSPGLKNEGEIYLHFGVWLTYFVAEQSQWNTPELGKKIDAESQVLFSSFKFTIDLVSALLEPQVNKLRVSWSRLWWPKVTEGLSHRVVPENNIKTYYIYIHKTFDSQSHKMEKTILSVAFDQSKVYLFPSLNLPW